jgi:uncharacterized protein (TIGR02217 family)
MAWDNIVLNTSLATMSRGDGWEASRVSDARITTTRNRSESRSTGSPWPLKTYDIPWSWLNSTTTKYVYDFYDARNGPIRSFLLWDRDYFYVSAQQIGVGDGVTTQFQLSVTGGDSANTFIKPILHPVPTGTAIPPEMVGGVAGYPTTTYIYVFNNGVQKVEGTDFTVDATTGIMTWAVPPVAGHDITATFWYYTVVRFVSQKLSLKKSGITGSVATSLIECYNE